MTRVSNEFPARINYPDLDIIKLVMAFLVVEIHTRPLMDFNFAEKIIEGIDVVAVPFFFLASGFLCFRGLDETAFNEASCTGAKRVKKTVIKLLRLYLTWTLLFLPITIFGNLLLGNGLFHALATFIRGTLFIGENYYSWPLWYLLASVIGFALVYFCLRKGIRLYKIVIISLCFLFLGYGISLIQSINDAPAYLSYPVRIYSLVFVTSRNGLFEGFFYISAGAAFGMKYDKLNNIPILLEITFVVIGLIGNQLINGDAHLPFCAVLSIGIFLLSVRRYGEHLKPHTIARKMSTVIYLVHMFFAVAFIYGIRGGTNPDLYANSVNRPLLYLVVLCGSILVSGIVIHASNKIPALKMAFGI